MLDIKDKDFFEKADGKSVDFYLEDDMFEIEGKFSYEDGNAYIYVIDAVSHMLKIAGKKLRISENLGRFTATRTEDGKSFDMEVNRVFTPLFDPTLQDFMNEFNSGITQFFNKPDDTLVWFDESEKKWFIEINKINMFSTGDIHNYESMSDMFENDSKYLAGKWQCIYYSAEVEEDEGEWYLG